MGSDEKMDGECRIEEGGGGVEGIQRKEEMRERGRAIAHFSLVLGGERSTGPAGG